MKLSTNEYGAKNRPEKKRYGKETLTPWNERRQTLIAELALVVEENTGGTWSAGRIVHVLNYIFSGGKNPMADPLHPSGLKEPLWKFRDFMRGARTGITAHMGGEKKSYVADQCQRPILKKGGMS